MFYCVAGGCGGATQARTLRQTNSNVFSFYQPLQIDLGQLESPGKRLSGSGMKYWQKIEN
jgi:hypothetical protein